MPTEQPHEHTLLLSDDSDDVDDDVQDSSSIPPAYAPFSMNDMAVVSINDGYSERDFLSSNPRGTPSRRDRNSKNYDEDSFVRNPDIAAATKKKEKEKDDERRSLKEAEWGRMFKMAAPEKWLLIAGTVALFLSSITVLVIPSVAGVIVDRVVNDKGPDGDMGPAPPPDQGFDPRRLLDHLTLNQIILVLFGIFFLGSIFAFFRATLFTIAGERVVARMRNMLFASVLQQEIAFFDETRTGDLTNRLSSDTMVLQNTVTVNISMGLRYTAQAFGGVLLLFYISWKLTLVMLSCVPVVAIGAVLYGLYVRRLAKERQDALARASEVAEESFSNIRTVRSFSKEDYETQRYAVRVDESYVLGKRIGIAYGGFAGAIAFVAQIALGLVLWYGAILVLRNELTPGQLTSFLMYTLTVAFSMGGIAALYADLMKAVGASERVFQLMDRVPKVRFQGGIKLDVVVGQVEYKNVRFSYPSRPDVPVLQGLSLSLSPGKVVALVGPSGGGKTTVANLLELFYYPQGGEITLDGYNIQQLDVKALHDHIGIVSQGPCLFAASIRDNIAYGMTDIPLDRIVQAAKLANAHEFIKRFPDAYDTMVGERGVRLSGGQKQRIAIARALLKDPRILLLDEATSDLDSESEHLVQEALDRLMKGRTVLVIAHRLSTVRNADQIIVIQRGIAAEQGTHDQLMEQSGIYRQLVSHQLHAAVEITTSTTLTTATTA